MNIAKDASVGVDLVSFKVCSLDCIYFQIGKTTCKTVARKKYVPCEKRPVACGFSGLHSYGCKNISEFPVIFQICWDQESLDSGEN